jgi:hypothetical protein
MPMHIDALLCDHAQVAGGPQSGGKLFISGANINLFHFPPNQPGPHVLNFAIAGVVSVPWLATNQPHKLEFLLITEDGKVPELPPGAEVGPEGLGGQMTFDVGRPAGLPPGDDQMVPFAFNFGGLPLMRTGKYMIELRLDGEPEPTRKLGFRVLQPGSPQVSFGPSTPGPIG